MPIYPTQLSKAALLPEHQYISTVNEEEQSTHEHVKQEVVLVPQSDILPVSAALIHAAGVANPNAKLIVFLPTARQTGIAAEIVSACLLATL